MQTKKAREIEGGEHVYRPSWRSPYVIAFWLFEAMVLGILWSLTSRIPLYGSRSHWTPGGTLFYAVVMATFFAWTFSLRGVSLTLDPRTFVYTQFAGTIAGGWRDVERIGRVSALNPFMRGEGLVLRDLRGQPRQPWRRMTWGYYGRFIPLARFDPHWRDGPIGADIARYAPWLLDTGVAPPGQQEGGDA